MHTGRLYLTTGDDRKETRDDLLDTLPIDNSRTCRDQAGLLQQGTTTGLGQKGGRFRGKLRAGITEDDPDDNDKIAYRNRTTFATSEAPLIARCRYARLLEMCHSRLVNQRSTWSNPR